MLEVVLAAALAVTGPQLEDVLAREQAGDDEGALKLADTLVHGYPNWVLPRLEAARLRLKKGEELGKAELDLEAAHSLAPENPRVHFLQALLFEEQGKPAAERKSLELALTMRDTYTEARAKLAGLCFAQQDFVCAEREYRALCTVDSSIAIHLQLAATLDAQNKTADAETELKSILAEQPDQPVAKRRLADLYERTGRVDLANKLRGKPTEVRKLRPLKKSKH
ncbi:MAG: tetratricopeptide repeat protein [Myxococcaceae bacterium]